MSKSTAKRRRRNRNGLVDFFNSILTLVVIGMVAAIGLVVFGVQRFYDDGPMGEDQIFNVAAGSSLSGISQALEEQGFVADRWTFQAGAMANSKQGSIRAGEYLITANASMADILKEITEGRAINYAVTIPEGWTSWEAVQRVNAAELLTGELVEIPAEGSLLPNTYSFERGANRSSIIDQMREAMDVAVAEVWATRAPDLPIETPEELVILASIVEKETGLADERPLVAAVFINRLNRGMRLQSDPTIIYGITNGEGPLGRGLRASEIAAETPYNTYKIDRLPIGPIANPGIDALKAVANPAETDALYFVADGTGGHAFAATYDQHQSNVAQWRRIEDERAKAAEEAQKAAEEAAAAAQADENASDEATSADQ